MNLPINSLRLSMLGVFFILMVSCSLSKEQESSALPEYRYLFYQPWIADIADWDEAFWQRELSALRTQGVRTLVIQWGQYEQVGVHNQPRFAQYIKSVVASAANNDIEVILGLYGENETFEVFESEQGDLQAHLTLLRKRHVETAAWYLDNLASTENVIGWYLPEEISDKLMASEATQATMLAHTLAVRQELPDLGKDINVYISAYCSNLRYVEDIAQGIREDLINVKVGVFLQAGNGVSKEALAACRETSLLVPSAIWVVEMFTQREDGHQVSYEKKALESTLRNYYDERSANRLAVFSFRYLPRQPVVTEAAQ